LKLPKSSQRQKLVIGKLGWKKYLKNRYLSFDEYKNENYYQESLADLKERHPDLNLEIES